MRKKLLASTLAFAMLLSTFSGMSALAAPSSLPELTSVDELGSIIVQTGTPLDDVVAQLPTEVGVALASTESTVLFEDDFSDPDQSRAKWALADPNGVVTFETGKMKLGATTNIKAVAGLADAQDWADYAVEAEVAGPESPANNFGVMFRCSNVTTSGPDSYNGYYAGIGSTTLGPGFVAGWANGGWHQLDADPAPGYTGGKTYALKVLVAGNTFHVYLDGAKVYEYTDTDSKFMTGTAGVRAYNVPFEVSSFVVRTLNADERAEMGAGTDIVEATASISSWSCADYNMDKAGEYTFSGALSGAFTNPAGKTASVKVTVEQAEVAPVLYYDFESVDGDTVADVSGNGNDGTLLNGPAVRAESSENNILVLSNSGKNGTNAQAVSMPTALLASLEDITLVADIRMTSTSTWMTLVGASAGDGSYVVLANQGSPSGGACGITTAIKLGSGSELRIKAPAGTSLPVSEWARMVYTHAANGDAQLLIDGTVVAEGNMADSMADVCSLADSIATVGRTDRFSDPGLNGAIDNVRVYDKVLSADELAVIPPKAEIPPAEEVETEYDTTTPVTIIADKNEGVEHDVNPYVKGNQMYLFMPAKASLGALNVTALDNIMLDGVDYVRGNTVTIDLSEGKTMTLVASGTTYTLSAMQSQLPTLYLNIDESQGTIAAMNGDPAHDTKCYGDLILDVPEDVAALKGWETQYALKMSEIKGRGNSTWGQPKKPYQIKLDKKTDLLGMGKHKTWIILANYMDSSLIRNRLVYNAGAEAGIEFSIDNEYIDVYMNGKYLGNYQLTEKVQVGDNRVEVTDIDEIVEDTGALPENITGGYLLEMDFRARNEAYHFSTPKFYHLEVKSPERDGATLDYISQYVSDFENALYSADGYNDKGVYYADYIDLDSFVTYYFFQEFIKNWDCMYSYGSIYFHKDVDGPLVAGPYWDFDWTMDAKHVPDYNGLFHTTEGWLGQIVDRSEHTSNEMWWRQFWKHEDFVIRLTELYEEKLGDIVAGWPEDIAAYNEELGVSATMNDIMWPYNLSHQDNVQSIVNFAQGRYEWIDNAVTELPVVSFQGGEDATGEAPASLYAEKDETFKLPENTFAKADFTFAGWSDGTNTYAAGADYTKATDGRLIFTAVWEESSQPVDKSSLTAIIEVFDQFEKSQFTAESWTGFAAALADAKAVVANADATQEDVQNAYRALIEARDSLVEITPSDVDKAALKELVEAIDGKYEESGYTAESWAELEKALEEAKAVIAKADA
ncbi:CotH kinase family protein, partial [Clostridiaceae bacterium NSJ-31]